MLNKVEGADKVRRALVTAAKANGSQATLARSMGRSISSLGPMISGEKPISDVVARALGFERVTVYRRIKP